MFLTRYSHCIWVTVFSPGFRSSQGRMTSEPVYPTTVGGMMISCAYRRAKQHEQTRIMNTFKQSQKHNTNKIGYRPSYKYVIKITNTYDVDDRLEQIHLECIVMINWFVVNRKTRTLDLIQSSKEYTSITLINDDYSDTTGYYKTNKVQQQNGQSAQNNLTKKDRQKPIGSRHVD